MRLPALQPVTTDAAFSHRRGFYDDIIVVVVFLWTSLTGATSFWREFGCSIEFRVAIVGCVLCAPSVLHCDSSTLCSRASWAFYFEFSTVMMCLISLAYIFVLSRTQPKNSDDENEVRAMKFVRLCSRNEYGSLCITVFR